MELDRTRFRELFEREHESVYRFLYRLTGNRADAEDLLQDAFVAVWRKRAQFEGRGSLAGYVRRTAYHLFLNKVTRQKRRRELAPQPGPMRTAPATAGEVAEREATTFLVDQVRRELASLPDTTREAFVLFRFEGLTAREIAEATDTPLKTIETRVRRATLELAQRLSGFAHLQAG